MTKKINITQPFKNAIRNPSQPTTHPCTPTTTTKHPQHIVSQKSERSPSTHVQHNMLQVVKISTTPTTQQSRKKENLKKWRQVYTPVQLQKALTLLQRYSWLDIPFSHTQTRQKLNTPPQPIVPCQNPLNTYVYTKIRFIHACKLCIRGVHL